MPNRLIIAAAGSGKTTFLVNEAIQDPSKKVLISTYTENNQTEIKNKIRERLGSIPSNIQVQTWFSFLIQHGIKPFQGSLHNAFFNLDVKGLHFSMTASGTRRVGQRVFRIPETQTKRYYLDSINRVYSDKAAKFAVKIDESCEGASISRISRLFDLVCIDEVQDLAGYDLDFVKLLLGSESEVLLVGDPRQVTYLTHHENRHSQYKQGKIKDFCLAECSQVLEENSIDEASLSVSHRNPQEICDVANALYTHMPAVNSCDCCTNSALEDGHVGVYLVKPEHESEYLNKFNPTILRWDSRKDVPSGFQKFNMGESKGKTLNRVLIYPTNPIKQWITNNNSQFAEGSRAKFYVAITRARLSSAILFNYDDETNYQGFVKYQPEA